MIINPKLGDKIITSNTDTKLSEFRVQVETNGSESTKKQDDEVDDEDESPSAKAKADSQKSPCDWKFYKEQANDELYNTGHRIQITHHKVNFCCCYWFTLF